MNAKPACPACRTNKHVIAQGVSGDMFFCRKCSGIFDSEPNEGGDYSDRNPAARLERQERRRARR